MLKLLVKKQLTEIFRAYIYDAKKNRARSKAATVGYIIFFVLLMVGVIGGMFTVLSLTMCRSMAKAGMSWPLCRRSSWRICCATRNTAGGRDALPRCWPAAIRWR